VPRNPPGFYLDESSIAYNAHAIAQTGRDEYGNAWPLYFRAFGEYKNPTYVYILAALYRLTGPSILVARSLSVALGLLGCVLLGILALQMTKRRSIGVIVGVIALLTPWLFELSRMVFEVALYPLALALFLILLHRLSDKARWSQVKIFGLALALALLTYSYSIGRLLAPLLSVGLVFFLNRRRLAAIIQTWAVYAVTLIPLFVFNQRHPGALLARFYWSTYITPQSTSLQIATEFIKHYFMNISPRHLLISGDLSPVIHIPSLGSLLIAPALMIAGGIILVLRRHRDRPWWRFVLYGVLVSIVPASLTRDEFPSPRLIALPIFLLVLSVPTFVWLLEESAKPRMRQTILVIILIASAAQIAFFQWQFHRTYRYSATRLAVFDAQYPELLTAAVASGRKPIYLLDHRSQPGYIQAYWYGTLRGMNVSEFVRLPSETRAPAGAVVITTEENPGGQIIARTSIYTLYLTPNQQ
jgi:4-amino-4-deoxy-L-arabinose transferase-like glycosyltransferase